MGFLDNFKKSDNEMRYEALAQYNIFEGVDCDVIFPNSQLKIATYIGLTRSAATLTSSFVVLTDSSRVNQNDGKIRMESVILVANKGLIFKQVTHEGKDLRIPYENVIRSDPGRGSHEIIISLLENQEITVELDYMKPIMAKIVVDHITNNINERACGAQLEETGWHFEYSAEPAAEPEIRQESTSLMDELERLGNMYEKGLLTDEEFAAMKKKLIEGY